MHSLDLDGTPMPALGFGTWQLTGEDCLEGVADALALGYRHLDTAQVYGNEAEVGRALEESGVPRDQVFLTTKVFRNNLEPVRIWDSLKLSLEKLRVDRVDLLLIHWPVFDHAPLEPQVEAFLEAQHAGLTKHIGVSNFTLDLMSRALNVGRIVTNQVEYHPFLSQQGLLSRCRLDHVALTAYSPLARGQVLDDPTLVAIGERHDRSAAQVALRWLTQQDGVSAIPKAASHAHRVANLESQTFTLSDEEMTTISALARPDGRVIDPPFAPEWD